MTKHELKAIEVTRKMLTNEGKSATEIDPHIGNLIAGWQRAKAIEHEKVVKAAVETKRIENLPDLSTLIDQYGLNTLCGLVGARERAREALKTASVESYIDALKAEHLTDLAVLTYAHQWVQDVPKDLELFKIDNKQYLIKERTNGVKYIGFKTIKDIT